MIGEHPFQCMKGRRLERSTIPVKIRSEKNRNRNILAILSKKSSFPTRCFLPRGKSPFHILLTRKRNLNQIEQTLFIPIFVNRHHFISFPSPFKSRPSKQIASSGEIPLPNGSTPEGRRSEESGPRTTSL
jgi:hypothetical protein